MKKILALFFLTGLYSFSFSQKSLFLEIKNNLRENHPEINTADKLIVFTTWSANDLTSRETNKDFDKTYGIYEFARLRGGLNGMVAVAISRDASGASAIILGKDGIKKLIPV